MAQFPVDDSPLLLAMQSIGCWRFEVFPLSSGPLFFSGEEMQNKIGLLQEEKDSTSTLLQGGTEDDLQALKSHLKSQLESFRIERTAFEQEKAEQTNFQRKFAELKEKSQTSEKISKSIIEDLMEKLELLSIEVSRSKEETIQREEMISSLKLVSQWTKKISSNRNSE